jgi:hypothetical protein
VVLLIKGAIGIHTGAGAFRCEDHAEKNTSAHSGRADNASLAVVAPGEASHRS